MQRDARAYLWDALQAAELLGDISRGPDFAGYQANAMLRSAVERQFEIIGEALNQLSRVDATGAHAALSAAALAGQGTVQQV